MIFFQSVPEATIKLFIVFFFVLFLIRKSFTLGNSFLAGATFMGILYGLSPIHTARIILSSTVFTSTLTLSVLVLLILIFSKSMEITGHMTRMLSSFRGLIKRQSVNLIIFPSLIGLLPMPGGAVFSAPMVKELASDSDLSETHLSIINYWFRHIWEYWWPLYPGVLLAVTLSGLDLFTFILYMLPFSCVAVIIGTSILKGVTRHPESVHPDVPFKPFIIDMIPVLIVIAGGPLAGIVLVRIFPEVTIARESGLIAALASSVLLLWWKYRTPLSTLKKILIHRTNFNMVYMILTILAFKSVLKESNAVEQISAELTAGNIPVSLIAFLLPFFVGIITGVTVAFVGISLPVIIPLVISSGNEAHIYAYVMLAITGGFSGVLLSPLHLCLVLSNNYFGAGMKSVYVKLIPLCFTLMASGGLYYLISIHYSIP